MSVKDRGRRLSPESLHAFLERLDMTKASLSLVTGTRSETVHDWLLGKREIPMWLHPFLEMMTVPVARQLAERTVDVARRDDRPRGLPNGMLPRARR